MSRQADLIRANRIRVVAGILLDSTGRILITERVGDAAMKGDWEFPGGKIDAGETAAAALVRELAEELDIDVLESSHFLSLEHDYEDRRVDLAFFLVTDWRRDPRGCEGQALQWVDPVELDAERMLAADVAVVQALRERA